MEFGFLHVDRVLVVRDHHHDEIAVGGASGFPVAVRLRDGKEACFSMIDDFTALASGVTIRTGTMGE